jgi:LacI family transcriptional regulator
MGRQLLQGIAHFSQYDGPWCLEIFAECTSERLSRITSDEFQGVIARLTDTQAARHILQTGLPIVAIGSISAGAFPPQTKSKVSQASSNPEDVVRLAANHLLERNFRSFAFVGCDERAWSRRRELAFQRFLAQRGHHSATFRLRVKRSAKSWEREQYRLARWLDRRGGPLGVFACDDECGRHVIQACAIVARRVPQDVAVIGVDNDEIYCEMPDTPLSSVALDGCTAGFRAAEILSAMMSQKIRKPRHIVIEATGVIARRSTDTIAHDDGHVAAALRLIQLARGPLLNINWVVENSALSRLELERRFRTHLGRSIREGIQIARFNLAKQLLSTQVPINHCAERVGFTSVNYFSQFFTARAGKTPQQFRRGLLAVAR